MEPLTRQVVFNRCIIFFNKFKLYQILLNLIFILLPEYTIFILLPQYTATSFLAFIIKEYKYQNLNN